MLIVGLDPLPPYAVHSPSQQEAFSFLGSSRWPWARSFLSVSLMWTELCLPSQMTVSQITATSLLGLWHHHLGEIPPDLGAAALHITHRVWWFVSPQAMSSWKDPFQPILLKWRRTKNVPMWLPCDGPGITQGKHLRGKSEHGFDMLFWLF